MPGYAMRLGFSEAGAFRLVSTLLVGALVLQLPVGYLADKVRPRTLSLVLAALAAVGAAAWPFLLAHHALAYVVVFVWGGVFVGMYTVMLTEVGSRFEGPDLVGVYSVMSVFWGLGALAGPSLVGGAVLASPAYGLPLAVAAGCALFFVAALAFDAPAPRAKG
jgi:predicted MFS family arabinose efflux permease